LEFLFLIIRRATGAPIAAWVRAAARRYEIADSGAIQTRSLGDHKKAPACWKFVLALFSFDDNFPQ